MPSRWHKPSRTATLDPAIELEPAPSAPYSRQTETPCGACRTPACDWDGLVHRSVGKAARELAGVVRRTASVALNWPEPRPAIVQAGAMQGTGVEAGCGPIAPL